MQPVTHPIEEWFQQAGVQQGKQWLKLWMKAVRASQQKEHLNSEDIHDLKKDFCDELLPHIRYQAFIKYAGIIATLAVTGIDFLHRIEPLVAAAQLTVIATLWLLFRETIEQTMNNFLAITRNLSLHAQMDIALDSKYPINMCHHLLNNMTGYYATKPEAINHFIASQESASSTTDKGELILPKSQHTPKWLEILLVTRRMLSRHLLTGYYGAMFLRQAFGEQEMTISPVVLCLWLLPVLVYFGPLVVLNLWRFFYVQKMLYILPKKTAAHNTQLLLRLVNPESNFEDRRLWLKVLRWKRIKPHLQIQNSAQHRPVVISQEVQNLVQHWLTYIYGAQNRRHITLFILFISTALSATVTQYPDLPAVWPLYPVLIQVFITDFWGRQKATGLQHLADDAHKVPDHWLPQILQQPWFAYREEAVQILHTEIERRMQRNIAFGLPISG